MGMHHCASLSYMTDKGPVGSDLCWEGELTEEHKALLREAFNEFLEHWEPTANFYVGLSEESQEAANLYIQVMEYRRLVEEAQKLKVEAHQVRASADEKFREARVMVDDAESILKRTILG